MNIECISRNLWTFTTEINSIKKCYRKITESY